MKYKARLQAKELEQISLILSNSSTMIQMQIGGINLVWLNHWKWGAI